MSDIRLRFGVLDPNSEEAPTPDDLDSRLNTAQTQLPRPRSRPRRTFPEVDGGYFFEFATRVEQENQRFGDDGDLIEYTTDDVLVSRILYFDGGGFVFESRQRIPDERIPAFLLQRSPEQIEEDVYEFFDRVEQEEMREIFHDTSEVSRIRFGQVGRISDDSGRLSVLIDELGDEVGKLQLSRGRDRGRNLKESELVNRLVDLSEIRHLTFYGSDGDRRSITGSAGLVFAEPSGDIEEEVAEVQQKAEPFLRRLLES